MSVVNFAQALAFDSIANTTFCGHAFLLVIDHYFEGVAPRYEADKSAAAVTLSTGVMGWLRPLHISRAKRIARSTSIIFDEGRDVINRSDFRL
jgi:hypothetical protein